MNFNVNNPCMCEESRVIDGIAVGLAEGFVYSVCRCPLCAICEYDTKASIMCTIDRK